MIEKNDPLDLFLIRQVAHRIIEEMRLSGEHCRTEPVDDHPAEAGRCLGKGVELLIPEKGVEGEQEWAADEEQSENHPTRQTDRQAVTQRNLPIGVDSHR